ncbi:hypothetical protein ACIB24_16230 [Spongisporangium articulatum]|uniref:TIGR02569 family protein n=1 Tax=Spongisporangium articulatum TaxID=3362603 RepID=A0ABW8AQH2_9ACTN
MSGRKMPSAHPSPAVLDAFGAAGPARRLPGGQGSSWAAGDLVFKPVQGPTHAWLAEAFADVVPDGFRLAAPARTRTGAWTCAGWSATHRVEGHEPDFSDGTTWSAILAAARAFHRAVGHVERPGFLASREDSWARADRVAWGEADAGFRPEFDDLVRRLRPALAPLGRSQLVHGDLTGNVLFAVGMPPAIIDISPYWRPPAYAEGVVVADALCWHAAPASLLETLDVPVAAVARALLFRMATTNDRVLSGTPGLDVGDEAERYGRAVALIGL